MANRKYTGSDLDIDLPAGISKAYVVYWDYAHKVIKQVTMYAETLYPINLVQAICVFKPEFAKGANVQFEYADGTLTEMSVMRF